jgi:uncharacterized protein YqgV (UPF0045/DUF77 family)
MFTGAQVALHPMCDGFVDVILEGIAGLAPYRDRLELETDELSTRMIGPPEALFPAMRDLFAGAARTGAHVVLAATVSRGCPGEPDDPRCATPRLLGPLPPVEARVERALEAVRAAAPLGVPAVAQLSLYPLGAGAHMDEIEACIRFLRESGVHDRPKNFCTKLRGDAGPLFTTVAEAFLGFGAPEAHVALDLKVSANSPSAAV